MRTKMLLGALLLSNGAIAADIPDFLDVKEVKSAEFVCLGEQASYSAKDQKYIDTLWNETLSYLEAYAVALTNDQSSGCLNSDTALIDSTEGGQSMCVMDRRDMKLMVKNIYQVLNNKDEAKKCFGAREDVSWIYNPGGELTKNSPVAQHFKRTTFKEFFDKKVTDKDVKKYGEQFTKNF